MPWRQSCVIRSLLTGFVLLTSCGQQPGMTETDQLTFWTTEVEPERLTVQQSLADRFQQETGVAVIIVPVEESELSSRLEATNSLPDVVFLPLELVAVLTQKEILDRRAATAVITQLGEHSFSASPLNLVSVGSEFAAIPMDGWGQLLLYRKDWFAEKNLPEPKTWDTIRQAARSLHKGSERWAIEVATDPTQVYMQQVFEQLALSNNCQLVNSLGQIALDTPACVATLEFYKQLVLGYTPPGNISWQQTRQDFQLGMAAMILWSPFILDELAGLNSAVPVTPLNPPLHQRVGIVATLSGPDGQPSQWGQVNYLAMTAPTTSTAQQWVTFLLTDENYLTWLSMAPEGKFPLRPDFVREWKLLKIGVDRRVKIDDVYSETVIDLLTSGVNHLDRWGFAEGQGVCVGSIYSTQTISQVLQRYLKGEIATATETAQQMKRAVAALDGCA